MRWRTGRKTPVLHQHDEAGPSPLRYHRNSAPGPLTPSVPEKAGPRRIQDYLDCDLTLYELMQKYGVTPDDSYYAYGGQDRL